MNDSDLISSRKRVLKERVWAAFEAEEFVLELDPDVGRLLVREPTHGSTHRMSVVFDVDRAVADWDELLTNPLNPIDHTGWSEVDIVVAELVERLWDGAMVVSPVVDRLVYENGYFEGRADPSRLIPRPVLAEGPFKWVLSDDENPPGIINPDGRTGRS